MKFLKEKGEIESKNNSLSIVEMLSGNYHNYDLKNENGIKYHLKYLIRNNKLFNYRIDNGKIVKYAKDTSQKSSFFFLNVLPECIKFI